VYQEVNPLELQLLFVSSNSLRLVVFSDASVIQTGPHSFLIQVRALPCKELHLDLNGSSAIRLTSSRSGARFWEMDESLGIVTVISVYL
jgi:hypothetical protein